MSLRDTAIVAYAETKVMKKSDRDVWVLMGEILSTLNQVGDQIENLQQSGVQRTIPHEDKQAVLSNAFVLSVKSAAKHGLALEG